MLLVCLKLTDKVTLALEPASKPTDLAWRTRIYLLSRQVLKFVVIFERELPDHSVFNLVNSFKIFFVKEPQDKNAQRTGGTFQRVSFH